MPYINLEDINKNYYIINNIIINIITKDNVIEFNKNKKDKYNIFLNLNLTNLINFDNFKETVNIDKKQLIYYDFNKKDELSYINSSNITNLIINSILYYILNGCSTKIYDLRKIIEKNYICKENFNNEYIKIYFKNELFKDIYDLNLIIKLKFYNKFIDDISDIQYKNNSYYYIINYLNNRNKIISKNNEYNINYLNYFDDDDNNNDNDIDINKIKEIKREINDNILKEKYELIDENNKIIKIVSINKFKNSLIKIHCKNLDYKNKIYYINSVDCKKISVLDRYKRDCKNYISKKQPPLLIYLKKYFIELLKMNNIEIKNLAYTTAVKTIIMRDKNNDKIMYNNFYKLGRRCVLYTFLEKDFPLFNLKKDEIIGLIGYIPTINQKVNTNIIFIVKMDFEDDNTFNIISSLKCDNSNIKILNYNETKEKFYNILLFNYNKKYQLKNINEKYIIF